MANLFEGLESLGLGGLKEMKVFESKENAAKAAQEKAKAAAVELKEEDFIFDKTYMCPICDNEFKAKTVRTGKLKLISSDSDLRPRYQFDTLKYDAVTCPRCGYSALVRYHGVTPTSGQSKLIRENVCASFTGIHEPTDILTYDDAITRHKLSLVCAVVKRGKASEKAFTCLKLAWLLRGKRESLAPETPNLEEEKKKLLAQEKDFLTNAYDGFTEAFSKENFPMCGMDETTVTYLSADLARQLGKYEEALRLIARVITSREANERIKEKARTMKEQIFKETGHKEA